MCSSHKFCNVACVYVLLRVEPVGFLRTLVFVVSVYIEVHENNEIINMIHVTCTRGKSNGGKGIPLPTSIAH